MRLRPPADDSVRDSAGGAAPFKAFNRVSVVIFVVAAIIIGIAFAVYASFGGKTHGSTAPAPITRSI